MIWLIGNKGMLGTEIARQLTEKKIEYVGTDIDVDITSYQALSDFAKNKSIKWIINCAAYTAVDKAESDIELAKKLNEYAPANIAQVAEENGANFIHISTDYVFNGVKPDFSDNGFTEDMPTAPTSVYGLTKLAGEENIPIKTKNYYILRTAWLYGWAGKNYAKPFVQTLFSKNNELSSHRFCLQSVCYQTCFVNFIRSFVVQPLMNPFTIEELYKFSETFSQFLYA